MERSIQHFCDVSIGVFGKVIGDFYKDPTNIAGFVQGITEEIHNFGIMLIQETLETMDQMLCDNGLRRLKWTVEQHNRKSLLTSLGNVTFTKTLFENKETGEMSYLLDKIMGLEKGERITEDAEAAMLEEAVQTSYRRGGEAASILDKASKQTVKTKIHGLKFPAEKGLEEKRQVEYLYIEADEDHIALQFQEEKGDLVKDDNGRKQNNAIVKLVYVHEGIEPEAPRSKRHRLVNPHYFSRTSKGITNAEFWKGVYDYIDSHYDLGYLKRIYVNSDGGGWIKTGLDLFKGSIHVLDGYHLERSIGCLVNHMKDSADDVRDDIYRHLRNGTKSGFRALARKLEGYFPEGEPTKKFRDSADYILSNWSAARYRLVKTEGIIGSSTEGHVSHVLASRMSTQAMGWSMKGADKMAQLRAYYMNGGDMLELVRFQKQEQPKAAGAEGQIFSAEEMIRQDRMLHSKGTLGKYYDAIRHSICVEDKKKIWFQSHIWGL